ncbi:hypothetical protein D3C71_78670 [compost metagenome]
MIWFQKCIDTLFLLSREMKGRSSVREEYRPPELMAFLTGYSISGFAVSLYCQKKYYVREYWRWWVPNYRFSTFYVFATATNDAPESLRMACDFEVELPPQAPWFLSTNLQRKAAIRAYLDLVIERMRMDQSFHATLV